MYVYIYIHTYMYMLPDFECPLEAMKDEPICTVHDVNRANFVSGIDFEEVK